MFNVVGGHSTLADGYAVRYLSGSGTVFTTTVWLEPKTKACVKSGLSRTCEVSVFD